MMSSVFYAFHLPVQWAEPVLPVQLQGHQGPRLAIDRLEHTRRLALVKHLRQVELIDAPGTRFPPNHELVFPIAMIKHSSRDPKDSPRGSLHLPGQGVAGHETHLICKIGNEPGMINSAVGATYHLLSILDPQEQGLLRTT